MRIVLLNPPRVDGVGVVREERYEHRDIGACYPPLSLLNTAGALKNTSHEIKLVDANGFNLSKKSTALIVKEFSPDLIVARLGFDTLETDLEFVASLGIWLETKIVVRNRIAAEYSPIGDMVRLKKGITALLAEPPEVIIMDLIADIELKKEISSLYFGSGSCLEKLAGISPDYSLLPDLTPYHSGVAQSHFALLSTSFGCPFKCTFCAYQGSKVVFRDPKEVVDDLERLVKDMGVTHLLLFDDLFMMKPANVEIFCNEIIRRGLNIKWIACTRADFLAPGLMNLMKKSGLIEMAIGIESGSPKVLEQTGKGIVLDDIRRSARLLHEHDILFYAMAIVGLPGETEKTVMETVDFLIDIDPFYAQFCLAVPFPNTPIFKWYEERGFLLSKNWSEYWPLGEKSVVRTEELTGEQIVKLRNRAYRKFVMRPGYLLRKINLKDPLWSIRAAGTLATRMLNLFRGGPVR